LKAGQAAKSIRKEKWVEWIDIAWMGGCLGLVARNWHANGVGGLDKAWRNQWMGRQFWHELGIEISAQKGMNREGQTCY
jgi:hypothetical protein